MNLDNFFDRHPVLAESAAIALCRRLVPKLDGVDWRVMTVATRSDWAAWRKNGYEGNMAQVRVQTRDPPLPSFRLLFGDHSKLWPKNRCPVCAQPTYSGGDWWEGAGKPRWNKHWHAPCRAAHAVWRHPVNMAFRLAMLQGGRCALSGAEIVRIHDKGSYITADVEVDHVLPLWRLRADGARFRWPDVLRYWGAGNLQALSGAAHKQKTAEEARERHAMKLEA